MFYTYILTFEDGEAQTIDIQIDPKTMTLFPRAGAVPPDWAFLDFCKCTVCPLNGDSHKYCPVAANLARVTRIFSNKTSVTRVSARVIAREREYLKKTSLQSVLSSITGLYMATSGCPVMEPLKGMARHHLPFATLEETAFRAVSTYLLHQHHLKKKGEQPDWDLKNLNKAYKDIEALNLAMTDRVRKASQKDANYNAVIILDAFAKMVPWTIERGLPS